MTENLRTFLSYGVRVHFSAGHGTRTPYPQKVLKGFRILRALSGGRVIVVPWAVCA
jgi:hypothetical protein